MYAFLAWGRCKRIHGETDACCKRPSPGRGSRGAVRIAEGVLLGGAGRGGAGRRPGRAGAATAVSAVAPVGCARGDRRERAACLPASPASSRRPASRPLLHAHPGCTRPLAPPPLQFIRQSGGRREHGRRRLPFSVWSGDRGGRRCGE